MPIRLPDVVRAFGVEPDTIRRIHARANIHWRVRAGREVYVLRRYAAAPLVAESAAWEQALVDDLAALGWPVARSTAPPRQLGDGHWLLMHHLAGREIGRARTGSATYRRVGAILARLHLDIERMPRRPQRPGWGPFTHAHLPVAGGLARRGQLLARLQRAAPDIAARYRPALEALEARDLPAIFAGEPLHAVHADFAPWNLLQRGGRLSGLLDFDIGHVDVFALDVAMARRGYHDPLVHGYLEVRPLPPAHLAALDGLWLASLFYGLWFALEGWERDGVDRPEQLTWGIEQLAKTRPYQPA
jgi:Ser/Thr protein kinase RdoA (MazF antagonist)